MLLKLIILFSVLSVVYADTFSENIEEVSDSEEEDSGEEFGIPLDEEVGEEDADGPGKPLFLTPYIESGQIEEGRKAAKSKPLARGIKSYSGFLTVNKRFNSNIFFWYFVSVKDPENAPIVVWLQGGPGASSLFGLFNENGPYIITKKGIKKRRYSWHKTTNLIYFDNPVGTGFSFTGSDDGYAKNQTVVGRDLYSAAIQFLKLFPHLQKNEFYITGESYAGKYVPAFGHAILHRNRNSEFKINLQGLFIGDGWTDPVNMLVYGDYLYQLGLVDHNGRDEFHKLESAIKKKIHQKKWKQASEMFDKLVGDETSLYYKYTGLVSYYNYYNVHSGDWEDYEEKFLNSVRFRKAVHVGNLTYNNGDAVLNNLYEDVPKSIISWVVELLKHYQVVLYSGQLDVICAYPLTINYLTKMKWDGRNQYKHAKRHFWTIGDDVAGYYKSVKKLTEVLVRNSGHMVPTDEPKWAFYLLNELIFNKTLGHSELYVDV